MQTIFNFLKETFQFLLAIWLVEIIGKIFLKRTLIGKLILSIVKDIYLSLKVGFKISRNICKIAYKESQNSYKFINKQYEKINNRQGKKAVNGNSNIIDFKKVTKKHK